MQMGDTGEAGPQMEIDAEVGEGLDEPEGKAIEDQLADEAIGENEEDLLDEGALEETPAAPLAAPPPAPQVDIQQLVEGLKQGIAQLVPKPPPQKNWWDDPKTLRENMLANPEKFHKGLHEILQFKLNEAVTPLQETIDKQNQILAHLYARSPERANFGTIRDKANQIAQKYGVPYQTALRMASDEVDGSGKKPQTPATKPQAKRVRVPPPHASAPDTSTKEAASKPSTGPATFDGIFREMRAAKKGR